MDINKYYLTQNPVQVSGSIIGSDFNRHGKVIEIMIETVDYEQYIILNDERSRALFDCLFEFVTIDGKLIGENESGLRIIKVKHFNQKENK